MMTRTTGGGTSAFRTPLKIMRRVILENMRTAMMRHLIMSPSTLMTDGMSAG